jgi:hypothetical protein
LASSREIRDEQVDARLLAAAHAGAVATDHRVVVRLLQQHRVQDPDTLIEVADLHEAVGSVGQPLPERPVVAELLDDALVLLHGQQGVVRADLDAEVAPLAGERVHRDR